MTKGRDIRVLFIFGMSGVGKNYIGDNLSTIMDIEFFDADNEFNSFEIEYLKKVTFTDDMRGRDHYRLVKIIHE